MNRLEVYWLKKWIGKGGRRDGEGENGGSRKSVGSRIIVDWTLYFLQQNRENDPLLRSLGFNTTSPSPSQSSDHIGLGNTTQVGQKRPGEDGDLNIAVKRPVDGSQVSSSGTSSSSSATSKLWEKNKMLASLLAKQPPQSTNIPPIPASVISATPQVRSLNKFLC